MYDVQYTAPQQAGTTTAVIYSYVNSSGYVAYNFVLIPFVLNQVQQDFYNAAVINAATYALANSYTLSGFVSGWYPDVATGSKSGVISASSATGLATLLSAVAPVTYQALISQTGTSAPTGATLVNSYPGTPTFTLARTGTGVYTIAASSPVFSTTKTALLNSALPNPLANLTYVVNSTTLITITTSVNSLISLLGLGFTSTPTDALLSKTMIYIPTFA